MMGFERFRPLISPSGAAGGKFWPSDGCLRSGNTFLRSKHKKIQHLGGGKFSRLLRNRGGKLGGKNFDRSEMGGNFPPFPPNWGEKYNTGAA